MSKKKVSACIIAYNHAHYIKECLDGAVSQDVNFSYEIIIGDDKSSDSTNQICTEYVKKYPSLIKLFSRNENIGMIGNWIETIQNCNGDYIALCEGDDYWTDPLKLQKQIDFLEANPDYSICFHKVKVLKDGLLQDDLITKEVPDTTSIKDLAKGNYMHTCSVVFKNGLIDKLPDYFYKSPIADYFLHMLNARYGKIKFLDDSMGVYRLHEASVWSSKTQAKKVNIWIRFLKNILNNFDDDVKEILHKQIKEYTRSRNFWRIMSLKKIVKSLLFYNNKK